MPDTRYEIDPIAFQRSVGMEFKTIKNRVRDLIGDIHWPEEGRYKETILKNTLKKFLPENIGIGTGFILKKKNGIVFQSSQIDIIVYDTSVPVLLKEGDFVITTPEHVYAIIEVKTNLNPERNEDLKRKRDRNLEVIEKNTFYGIFAFDDEETNKENAKDRLTRLLEFSDGRINHITIGSRLFVKYFSNAELQKGGVFVEEDTIGSWGIYFFNKGMIYNEKDKKYEDIDLDGLAPAYFISNLIDSILVRKNRADFSKKRSWFLFPIVKGKQPHKIDKIDLPKSP